MPARQPDWDPFNNTIPSAPFRSQPSAGAKGRVPFREVLVFMIGGGSYAELQTIQEYSKRHPERQITYGCTELVTAEAFVKQLGQVAN